MVKIGIIDIPIFQVPFTPPLFHSLSNSSFAANLSNVCPSAEWTASVSCPSSSAGAEFARWNTTIRDAPTSVPNWRNTYRPRWISTILHCWVWGHLNACGPLQCATTLTNYEPNHTCGTSRYTGKPTGEPAVWHVDMTIPKGCQQEVVLKLVNMRPEEIAMLPPTERASVIQLVRLDLLYGRSTHWNMMAPAGIVRDSLTLAVTVSALSLRHDLLRRRCIPGLYIYPLANLPRPL